MERRTRAVDDESVSFDESREFQAGPISGVNGEEGSARFFVISKKIYRKIINVRKGWLWFAESTGVAPTGEEGIPIKIRALVRVPEVGRTRSAALSFLYVPRSIMTSTKISGNRANSVPTRLFAFIFAF